MKSVLRVVVALGIVAIVAGSARAEPPQKKEHLAPARLQVESRDGRYSVGLGGFLQSRYTASVENDSLRTSELGIPRTRLYFSGHLGSRSLRYRLMVGTLPYDLDVQLFEAYAEWEARPWLRLRMGRFKIPVLREWVESARQLASAERSAVMQLLLPGRDYGALASGDLGDSHLEYAFGAFNGAGDQSTRDTNTTPALAGRVLWNVQGRALAGEVDYNDSPTTMVLGASMLTTVRPFEEGGAHGSEQLGGAEFALRRHHLDVAVEVFGRRRAVNGESRHVLGGYASAGYYLARLRGSMGTRISRLIELDVPGATRTEVEFHVGYLPLGDDLKFVSDLGLTRLGRNWEPFALMQVQAAF